MECGICHERILLSKQNEHVHCPQNCKFVASSDELLQQHDQEMHSASHRCECCGAMFTKEKLANHVETECTDVFDPVCGWKRAECYGSNGALCNAAFPCLCALYASALCADSNSSGRRSARMSACARVERNAARYATVEMDASSLVCVARTRIPLHECLMSCSQTCQTYINIMDMKRHSNRCGVPEEDAFLSPQDSAAVAVCGNKPSHVSTSQRDQTSLECVYCCKTGFRNAVDLDQHVSVACRIAKSFATTSLPTAGARSNREESSGFANSSGHVRSFVQGRIRRKGDASALHKATTSLLEELNEKYSSSNNNADEDATGSQAPVRGSKALPMPHAVKPASSGNTTSSAKPKAKPSLLPLELPTGSTRSKAPPNSRTTTTISKCNPTKTDANVDIALSISSTSLSHHERSIWPHTVGGAAGRSRRGASLPLPRKLDKLQHPSSSSK